MILKGFKEKSNKKYINSELKKRVVSGFQGKIKQVGIIVNSQELIDVKWFDALATELDVKQEAVHIIVYNAELKEDEAVFIPTYTLKDFGWKGAIKDKDLKQFLNTEFDALISYYKEDITLLKLLTVSSKAKFKIGILESDERINDLIIKTKTKAFETFKKELVKYLNILNKL